MHCSCKQLCVSVCVVPKSEDPKLTTQEALFATNMQALRRERGWSQADLAEKMREWGVEYANQSTVSRIEQKVRPPRMIEALAVSEVFQMSIHALAQPVGLEFELQALRTVMEQARQAHARVEQARGEMEELVYSVGARLVDIDGIVGAGDHLDKLVMFEVIRAHRDAEELYEETGIQG